MGKGEVKLTLHMPQKHMRSGVTAPLILNLSTRKRWVSFMIHLLPPHPGNMPWYTLTRKLGDLQSHSECFKEENTLFPLPGIDP
jgi:hypothetical protein